jgi:hypothetical protein
MLLVATALRHLGLPLDGPDDLHRWTVPIYCSAAFFGAKVVPVWVVGDRIGNVLALLRRRKASRMRGRCVLMESLVFCDPGARKTFVRSWSKGQDEEFEY